MKIMKELHRLALSFLYALRGIGYAVKTQRNFRIHLTALMVVVVFNTMAQLSATHWCIELLCCMVVISMELVNTALESACDKISTKQHALLGHAKDAAAGAVLVSAIGSVVIAFLIFFYGNGNAYYLNTMIYFQRPEYAWVKCALLAGLAAALLFIFLPSILQKRKN